VKHKEEIPVRTPLLSGLINLGRPAKKVLRISAIILGLLAGQMQIAGTSNVFGYDVIIEVEDALHQAAKASQWHTHQDSIQRDVHDITFSLEQAWKAAEHSTHTERKDDAEQALLTLQRATERGYFDRLKTEPVLAFIRGLLTELRLLNQGHGLRNDHETI
jgi:hypothetical protein